MTQFKALVVRETSDKKFVRAIETRSIDDLPAGEVLIRVHYSSLNYKDALSAVGNRGVTRQYPHTPGVDAAGVVEESQSPDFRPGEEVIVTGYDLGMNTSGGFSQYVRVPAAWVVRRPESLTLREAMIYGTAGFAAAQGVNFLLKHGLTPDCGDLLVTGASGGVGTLALGMLCRLGFGVFGATGKPEAEKLLKKIGAKGTVSREELDDQTGKALLPKRWAGAIDTVGGNVLATVLKYIDYRGAVAACGNAASGELNTTVYPFILRGLCLYGVDSANCPMEPRLEVWKNISTRFNIPALEELALETNLEGLDREIDRMLAGKKMGRLIVNPRD